MTDFPTSNSQRARRRKPGMAGPVIGGILVFLWAFIFSVAQSFTKVIGTANLPMDLALGIGVGLAGGLAGAVAVWVIVYFVLGGRHANRGALLLPVLAGIALVGALPASGLRVVGAAMSAEQDAITAIRQRVDARQAAQTERLERDRNALMAGGFYEPRALAAPGGLARARTKVQALRDMMTETQAETERFAKQARSEVEALPVSGPRRQIMLRDFDAGAAGEMAETKITVELTEMLFDEMDAQLDILERRRWVMEYGNIAFTSVSDMNAFNTHARRVQEIGQELDARERARVQRQNTLRATAGR